LPGAVGAGYIFINPFNDIVRNLIILTGHKMAAPTKTAKPRKKKASPDEFYLLADEDLDTELFERNAAAFKEWLPNQWRRIGAVKTTSLKLLTNGKGEFDLEFRGERFYGKGHLTWAKERMKNFANKGGTTRLTLSAPDSSSLDDESNATIFRILKRAVGEEIAFASGLIEIDSFHVLVFGGGLCAHLPLLAEETTCQDMIVIEPNLEFLYLSLYVFDWDSFINGMVREGRHFSIVADANARMIAESVRDQTRYVNPAFMEGMVFFESYPNSTMARARDILVVERDTLTIGLGFLEDEIDMVRNSYHNLKGFTGKYYNKLQGPLPLPAFVIGSGPSLDNDLEFIKQNQANALIVSCGTSLRILLHNGIRPDFHVEIENVPVVADLMNNLSAKFDLSDITLLATSTVDPKVSQYFRQTIFYFRNGLASFPMFSQGIESTLGYSTPMVTNLGFSFAQEIGCRTIYNFGVDLGARNPAVHHAKDAPYGAGEVEFKTTINEPVPGNFGGTVYSEMVYLWAKQTMEYAMNRFSAYSIYYNCSDGVRLEGMVPKLSSTIELLPRDNKNDVVRSVVDRFPQYSAELFQKSWYDREPRKAMTEMRDRLVKICKTGKPPKHSWDLPIKRTGRTKAARYPLRYMMHIVRELIPPVLDVSTEIHYYRGSTFLCMAAINFYMMRVPKGPQRTKFLKIAKEEFIGQVERINTRVQNFYDSLEAKDAKTQ
jgi:hypothetical protein